MTCIGQFSAASQALHPFREYLWPNASAASGLGRAKDFHQWCVQCTSKHPLLAGLCRRQVSVWCGIEAARR